MRLLNRLAHKLLFVWVALALLAGCGWLVVPSGASVPQQAPAPPPSARPVTPRASQPTATRARPTRTPTDAKPTRTPPPTTRPTRTPPPAPSVAARPPPTAIVRGMQVVAPVQLPREAQRTLGLIAQGGPFPYRKDGVVFQNRERQLPRKPSGYYHEYTVETPGSADRGARRIITGDSGEVFYTDDHYASFVQVAP